MKTDDLIAVLAADTLPQATVAQRMMRSLPLAIGVSLMLFVLFWGLRPDLTAALTSPVAGKTLVPSGLVIVAGALAFALSHPGQRWQRRFWLTGLFIALLVAGFALALARDGLTGLAAALGTPALLTCLASIPALALPLLAAVLWALSAGAALQPRLTGAAGGLMAGGLAAAIYSLYCDQDAALFSLPAYSAAILMVALAGGLAGPRLLKW